MGLGVGVGEGLRSILQGTSLVSPKLAIISLTLMCFRRLPEHRRHLGIPACQPFLCHPVNTKCSSDLGSV